MRKGLPAVGFTGIEVLVVLVIVGVLGGGTTVAANNARPGDALFGLDLAIENLQERLTSDPVKKFELKVRQARERAVELESLGEELKTEASERAQERVQVALGLTNQALRQAEERVSDLAQTIPAADQSQAATTLKRVSDLLQQLQENREETSSKLTRLKEEIKDDEVKQRIETVTDGVGQEVRVEQKTDDDGNVERRVKVYQTDPVTGEEVKILDIEEKDGVTRVRTNDDDDNGDDEADEADDIDDEIDEENEPTETPKPTKTPTPTQAPTPTEAEESNSGSGSSESQTYEIRWKDGGFENANPTLRVGDKVEWENKEDELIQVASNPHPTPTGLPSLDSGTLSKGEKYTYTFTAAGTFGYHNNLSPDRGGTITVSD